MTLIETCRKERRCLVTLDLDFANPLVFKPSDYAGIAVLRLPLKPGFQDLVDLVRTLARGLEDLLGTSVDVVDLRGTQEAPGDAADVLAGMAAHERVLQFLYDGRQLRQLRYHAHRDRANAHTTPHRRTGGIETQ